MPEPPAFAPVSQAPSRPLVQSTGWPWEGVEWSLPFIAFLVYFFSVTSYTLGLGTEAMVTGILAVFFSSRDRLLITPMTLAHFGYLAVGTAAYYASPYPPDPLNPIDAPWKLLVILTLAVTTLNTWARLRFFIFFYLACFALFPLRGGLFNAFVYRAAEQGRVAWNFAFENPNEFSALMLFPLSLALGYLATERQIWVRRAALLGAGLIPLSIFLSQSRGTILALFIVSAVGFTTLGRARGRALLIMGGVSVVLALFAPKSVWDRLLTFGEAVNSGDLAQAEDQGSARQRQEIARVAWTIGVENPAIGIGITKYPTAHYVTALRAQFDRTAQGGRDAHNTYLAVFAETGIPGLACFLFMLGAAWMSLQRGRQAAVVLGPGRTRQLQLMQLGFAAFLLTGFVGTFDNIIFHYVQLAVIWSAGQVTLREATAARSSTPSLRG